MMLGLYGLSQHKCWILYQLIGQFLSSTYNGKWACTWYIGLYRICAKRTPLNANADALSGSRGLNCGLNLPIFHTFCIQEAKALERLV